jgi:two-component system, LytTR family, sensor kinase
MILLQANTTSIKKSAVMIAETNFHPLAAKFYRDPDAQFLFLQLIGWFGLALVSFFSLTLWYNQQTQLTYIAHTLVQSALGVGVSWPLRYFLSYLWDMKLWVRLVLTFVGVFSCSGIWAVLRISTFMYMTGEEGLWPDFGGWLFGSIFIFISWAALYHGIKYYQLLQFEHASLLVFAAENKEEQLKRSRAETFAHEAQLKMLRYQLNPHFLFNTLNAIASLVRDKDASKANVMIVQLSNFLRYSLDNDPIKRVTLKDEMEALKLYLNIEKTRFGDRLKVCFEIDPKAELVRIPSLILQPLAENAIKYAIAPMEEGGTITIKARRDEDCVIIELDDNGPGMPEFKYDGESTGVGLRNTIDRLHGFYGDCYHFQIKVKSTKGTSVFMKLPLKKKETIFEDLISNS